MSKKMKALLIIVALIIIIGLFFGITTIIRIVRLNNIYGKIENHIAKNNYYIISTSNQNGVTTKTEAYYKDGIGKFVASNGTYTWTDGTNAYMIDENNKTAYILDLNAEDDKRFLVSVNLLESLIPGYTQSFISKITLAGNLNNSIKNDIIDDEKCLKISIKDEKYIKTTWISKKTMAPIKSEIKFIESNDVIETKYEIKYQQTSLKQIELPNLSEYKIINKATGEEVSSESINNTNSNNSQKTDENSVNTIENEISPKLVTNEIVK